MLAHDRRVYARELGAGRIKRGGRRQPPEQLRHAVPSVGDHRRPEMVRAGHDIRDELRLLRIGHGWFEDADDGRDAWTETDRLANHGWVALEYVHPEPVCEHHSACCPRAFIGAVQQTAERRAKSHHVEKRSVDDTSLHDARLVAEAD